MSTRRAVTFALLAALVGVTAAVESIARPAPADAQNDTATWLALGDSYSSGEGIPGTVDVDAAMRFQGQNCQRATGQGTDAKAWAVRAADELPEFANVDFVACTGALSTHLAAQISEAQKRSGRTDWDLVTFSAGGNDIGFADVLKGCLEVNSVWGLFDLTPGCDISEADIRARIDSLRASIGDVYDTVARVVNPGGDVIVVGYPHLAEEYGRWSGWQKTIGTCEGLQRDDVAMLRSATGYLNSQIAGAVADADQRHRDTGVRFHFLDISHDPYEWNDDPGSRHGLCSQNPWLNGQTASVSSGDFRLERSFHPTQTGHDNTGRVLAELIRRDVTFDDAPALDSCQRSVVALALNYRNHEVLSDPVCVGGWARVDACPESQRDPEMGCIHTGKVLRSVDGVWTVAGALLQTCAETFTDLGAPDDVATQFYPPCQVASGGAGSSGGPASCGDIGFTPQTEDGAWSIVAEGISCGDAAQLVTEVRYTHNFYSGPRSFSVGGFDCTVVLEDDIIPSGFYTCDDGARRVTWEQT